MANPNTWNTEISTLLLAFREALAIITPLMDVVKIQWKDQDAYDDWDDIASTLYRNMVGNSIQHIIGLSALDKLAPYDLLVNSYDEYCYISVITDEVEEQDMIFVGFSTKVHPFDSVKYVTVNHDQTVNQDVLYRPVDLCNFELVIHKDGAEVSRTKKLNIEI